MSQTDKLADKLISALENLNEDDGEPYIFSSVEVAEIQSLLVFMRRVKALGWAGKWLFWAVIGLGTLALNWERLKGFFT